MDVGISKGIDAYFQVVFAGNVPIRTHVRTAKGAGGLTVSFNQQLWVPVMVPTMTQRIDLSM